MISGKNKSAIATTIFIFPFIIPAVAFVASRSFGSFPIFPWQMKYVSIFLMILSVLGLIRAKYRLMKSLRVSFGLTDLTLLERRFYVSSYGLLLVSIVLAMLTE